MSLLDEITDEYESEVAAKGVRSVRIQSFLPADDHPDYQEILVELLRVRMEHEAAAGQSVELDTILKEFPQLRNNEPAMSNLEFEQARLAKLYPNQQSMNSHAQVLSSADWNHSLQRSVHAPSFASLGAEAKSDAANRAVLQAGEVFGDFFVLGEIGAGAFASVYLARQLDLSARPVVLKVSHRATSEPHKLAQLQHPNVAQIFSLHQVAGFQIICMPFVGAATFADLITHFNTNSRALHAADSSKSATLARSVNTLIDTIANRQHSIDTIVDHRRGQLRRDWVSNPLPIELKHRWAKQNWEQIVCDLILQVAQGLEHAHSQNILHCDLKPANILIGDDGVPRLVDFNVSQSLNASSRKSLAVGGTLPYMAPEQICLLLGERRDLTPQSDLFSLGVVFYQLLSGRMPFKEKAGDLDTLCVLMLAERSRPKNYTPLSTSEASIDVRTMIDKLLAPSLNDRYQSAAQFTEDLQLHRQSRPLRHAPNVSTGQRFSKWVARHPKLTSTASVSAIAAVAILGIGLAWWNAQASISRHRSDLLMQEFDTRTSKAIVTAAGRVAFPDLQSELSKQIESLLEIGFRRKPSNRGSANTWAVSPSLSALQRQDRERVARQLIELENTVTLSQQFAARSKIALPALPALDELNSAKRELLSQFQIATDDVGSSESSSQPQLYSAIQSYLRNQLEESIQVLSHLQRTDPRQPLVWQMIGLCRSKQGNRLLAEQAFATCIALEPRNWQAWHSRGLTILQSALASHRESEFRLAAEDLKQSLALFPDQPETLFNLALCYENLQNHQLALKFIDDYLATEGDAGHDEVRGRLLRSRILQKSGASQRSQDDLRVALAATPRDAQGYAERGWVRMSSDPKGAMADFLQARELGPGNSQVLQNIAQLAMDSVPDPKIAQLVLDEWITLEPNNAIALASRGVFRARAGQRESAISDAQAASSKANTGYEFAMIASIYALCSNNADATDEPQQHHRDQAFQYLAKSFQLDWKLAELLVNDPDMRFIRSDSRFQKMLQLAQALAQLPSVASTKPARPESSSQAKPSLSEPSVSGSNN